MNESGNNKILYLSSKDVEAACQQLDTVAIIREMFTLHARGETKLPDEAYLGWANELDEPVRSLNMPGYLGGSIHMAGTKIINGNIANPTRGLPRASGLTLLYDNTTVQVACIMEGASISSLRTACVTTLSMELLRGKAIEHIAIIGAGVLALAHIRLVIQHIATVRQISIYDFSTARIDALYAQLSPLLQEHQISWHVASSAEMAVRPAQCIIPVTTTVVGYIPFSWLQPGAILVNVSLDDVLPDVVFQADKIFVDDWNLVKADSRRLLGRMYQAGEILGPEEAETGTSGQQRRIDGLLGSIVLGKAGRTDEDEIILVNPFGMAIADIAIASHVYQVALQSGLGLWLER
ncbi:ornithine cyclodeaminase [Ktedonobacteria bacterium brp13]|nr:ornithine cyclodeaminase [Ktedonobacteria bacterium brp13]